ncbi:MAG: efflux RND transporter periplasmic adaptor subunit [Phycisphaeraceae bacterium]
MPLPKRKLLTRVALPAVIVLATLSLVAYAARDAIRPATQVQTTRAVALSLSNPVSQQNQATKNVPTTVVAQAPGWIEPDPYPIYVGGLANGIVKKIHVLEGETVAANDVLVELIDDDAKLSLSLAKAELAKSEAARAAAQADLEEPIALQRTEAITHSKVDANQATLLRLDAEIGKEQARLDELAAAYDRLEKLSKQSVSALKVEEAKYRVQSQRAALEATRQRRPELEAQLQIAKAEHRAAKRDLELKTQLKRIHDEAVAARDAAQTRVEEAELRLERMIIKSPIDAVVMTRLVGPGSKVMLEMDGPHSSHAIHLYNPEQMQVRVDVPLADAAKVGLDQRAEIVVDVLPNKTFNGRVTRLVNRADIAKNTVQFKVAITDPSPLLKPDMLARIKFFSGEGSAITTQSNTGSPQGSPVAIKQSAVVERGEERFVWWISPIDQRITQRAVTLSQPRADGTIIVTSGLNPGDLIVDQPASTLQENQRIRSDEQSR